MNILKFKDFYYTSILINLIYLICTAKLTSCFILQRKSHLPNSFTLWDINIFLSLCKHQNLHKTSNIFNVELKKSKNIQGVPLKYIHRTKFKLLPKNASSNIIIITKHLLAYRRDRFGFTLTLMTGCMYVEYAEKKKTNKIFTTKSSAVCKLTVKCDEKHDDHRQDQN